MSWFGYDNRKSNSSSVFISHVSVELFMRLRRFPIVGEFLWSGRQFIDHDVQCFPVK